MVPETLIDLLRQAHRYHDTGLRFLDRREDETFHSWAELAETASEVAGSLIAVGIRPGQRVALIYPTEVAFFHAFFGILLVGAVPVPLYPPARLGRLEEYHRRTAAMVQASGAELILTSATVRRLLGRTIELADPPLGCLTLSELPRSAPAEAQPTKDDLALVQFSSGTTVDPKPVALSHRAILAQVDMLNGNWPKTGPVQHSGVSWLPLYHDMGLIGCIFPALERPGTLTLIGPEVFVTRPAIWLRAISRFRATISVAPNFAYGLCVEKIEDREIEGIDLGSWLVALNGAEPVAPAVLRQFLQRFEPYGFRPEALTPVYGLSEATLAVTFSDLDQLFRSETFDRTQLASEDRAVATSDGLELASVGRPLPGVTLRIVDEQGVELENDRVGRVLVRSPALMDGYLGRTEATRATFREGWLDTGDLGFLHEGELYLTSRAKDVVILRGRNHSPAEIEQAIDRVPGARIGCSVAVSRQPENGPTEQLLLFVEHRREAPEEQVRKLPEECRAAVVAATGLRADEVVVLSPGTLPRTSSGKLRRREALTLHLRGKLQPPRAVTPLLLAGAMAKSSLTLWRHKVRKKRRPARRRDSDR